MRRLRIAGLAAVLIFAAVAAAVSMQASQGKNAFSSKTNAAGNSRAHYATANVQNTSGQIRPLTQEEAQQLAQGLKGLVNPSADGLSTVRHQNGAVSMNLDGRFQNIAVARKNDNGSLLQSCVDNPQSAAAFFGIDQKLMGATKSGTSPRTDSAPFEKGTDQ
jgi:hypothetical protein